MQHSASVVSGGEPIARLTAVFQALSEPTRLRIMALVCRAGRDLCVCEFVDALEEPQYHVSRSLKILQKAGLVAQRREGRWVHYGVAARLDVVRKLVLKAVAAIPHQVLARDQRELNRRLKLREHGKCLLGVQKTHLLSRRN
jgi:ArsR family transcriptional regulator